MPPVANIVVDDKQLQIVPTQNNLVPGCEGGEAVRLVLDFTAADQYTIDLQNFQATRKFEGCQAIKVINRTGTSVLVSIPSSGDSFTAKANTEGWYNVICPNPIKLLFQCAGGDVIQAFIANVPIPGAVWPTV